LLIYSALHLSDQATYEETSPQKAHKAQKARLLAFFVPCVLFVVKFLHSSANRCRYCPLRSGDLWEAFIEAHAQRNLKVPFVLTQVLDPLGGRW
jgi:hypothetical protein